MNKITLPENRTVAEAHCSECLAWLRDESCDKPKVDMSFLDPPFNQGKAYRLHDDSLNERDYWLFMSRVCGEIYRHTLDGGCIYFMQREKNAEQVLRVLRETGWTFQNLIIWKKLTSAIPSQMRFGKAFQIICFATKGQRPNIFNRLRITPKLPMGYKPHQNGVYVTDIWEDIRELTSGYFAGDEAIRDANGERQHKQQSPVALLLRLILSSTMPGMTVLDPFAGSGTTAVVAQQLGRKSISLEIDPQNCELIQERLSSTRSSDDVSGFRSDYQHTVELNEIWPLSSVSVKSVAA